MRFDLRRQDQPSEQAEFRIEEKGTNAAPVSLQLRERAIAEFDRETAAESRTVQMDWSAHVLNAEGLIEGGESDLALELLEEILKVEPHHLLAFNLCKKALQGVTLDVARAWLKRNCSLRPTFEAYVLIAHHYYQQSDDARAESFYHMALSRLNVDHPELFEILKNMGNIAVRGGDLDAAEDFYNKAFTLNPSSDVLLVNYGTLEIQRQDYDRALTRFRQAVELNPAAARAWLGLALIHRHYGDHELAWTNLERALDLDAISSAGLELLLDWCGKDGRVEGVAERLIDALANGYLEVARVEQGIRTLRHFQHLSDATDVEDTLRALRLGQGI